MKQRLLIVILLIAINLSACLAHEKVDACQNQSLEVQILGSGGPELTTDRASSSYLVWQNDKAIVLIDAGGGSALRYGQSNAHWKDLKAVLFTHFHADHSNDLPALVKASWFGDRNTDLPIFGPYGNEVMPSMTEFIAALFNKNKGAFKYLSDMVDVDQNSAYKLVPNSIKNFEKTQTIFKKDGLTILAHKVKHGPIPAFAYIIQSCGKTLVFSGDTNGQGFENLELKNTDLFVAHNAVPENAGRIAKSLHITPSQIGEIAKHINTKKLILSHRMKRTLGKEQQTLDEIKKNYSGTVVFANDLDVFESVIKD